MTGRLLVALLVMGGPLAAICAGMALLDRLAARRERRAALAPVIRLTPPVTDYRKARP